VKNPPENLGKDTTTDSHFPALVPIEAVFVWVKKSGHNWKERVTVQNSKIQLSKTRTIEALADFE
jgi:hypothetical protein